MSDDSLWVEEFRPKNLEEMVLSEINRETFQKYIEDESIPNLMFGGPPGSGKTTIARILIDHIIKNESDVFILNGSDQTGVANIRENVTGFLKSPPMMSKIKIVFIDEADYLTGNAQANLRGTIEKYHEVGRFIFTCNFMSKMIEAIHSRTQDFRLEKMSEEFCLKQCIGILEKKEVKYKKPDATLVVKQLYPDLRRMIGTLQKHTIKGELKGINADTVSSDEKKMIGWLMELIEYDSDSKDC
jgi:replication factor C small subunit